MIKSLSVVFPMYNEANRLFRTFIDIEKFKKMNFIKDIEYIFVDDGSNDDSIKKVNDFFKNKKIFNYRVVKIKANTGKGNALKKGILKAKKDWILTLDADISVSLLQIKKWVNQKLIDNKNDVYFGSRNLKNSEIEFKFHRKILGIIFSFLLNILFNIDIKDTQCGFKLYPKKVAKKIFKNIFTFNFAHDIEILTKLNKKKIKVIELPVRWKHFNQSKVNIITDSLKMIFSIYKIKNKL
mgnify:CR=1 FL=1